MLERLFLGLFSESGQVVGMRIPGLLVLARLFAAEGIAIEETTGLDHLNDAFSIILPRNPLPPQKL